MPPEPENSSTSASLAYSLVDALLIRRLYEEHALMRQALETIYRQGHDFGDYWSHDVARDVLRKLRSAKSPGVQATEPESGG